MSEVKTYRVKDAAPQWREAFEWVPGMTLPDWCANCAEEVFTGRAGPVLIIWGDDDLYGDHIAKEGDVVLRAENHRPWVYGTRESFLEDYEEGVP
jgi:hypothetical protein